MSSELSSEQLNLTTYYPAPSGVYTNLLTTAANYIARDGGNVGIGTGAPTQKLHVNGTAVVTGSLGVGSAAAPIATVSLPNATAMRIGNAYLSSTGINLPGTKQVDLGTNYWIDNASAYFPGAIPGAGIQFQNGAIFTTIHNGAGVTNNSFSIINDRVGINQTGSQNAPLDVGPSASGVIIARQNNCVPTTYTMGTTPCVGANYVTNASGIYVNRIQLGSSGGDSTGTMLCCPLAAGAVTF